MKGQSGKRRPTELVRLWGEVWERWEWPDGAGREPVLREEVSGAVALTGSPTILAVPARLAVAVPLWIDSTDAAIVDETARLELDVRGLLGRRSGAEAVLRTVATEGERTLVLSTVFPADLPESVPVALFDRYEASPFLRPLAADALTIWREGGDLVAAVTRGATVIYWETLGWTDDAREISAWLKLMVLQLRSEQVVGAELTLCNELPGFKEDVLQVPVGVRLGGRDGGVGSGDEIKPTLVGAVFQWRPPAAVAADLAAVRRRRMRQVAMAGAAAYAGIAVVVLAYLGFRHVQIAGLKGRAEALAEEVGRFEPVARQWRQVGPTAEAEFYPLEILYQTVKHLPADGVRMTLFDIDGGRVLVEGDASPSRLAAPFFEALTSDPELAGFSWNMANPGLRPDGSARFQIQGTFAVP